MRILGVVIVTLCALVGCGRDPILKKAEADAAKARAARESRSAGDDRGAPAPGGAGAIGPSGSGVPGVGIPEEPPPGAPGSPPGGIAPDGGPTGADGQPLPGVPDEPAPGVPDSPTPGAPGSPPAAAPGAPVAVEPGSPARGTPSEPPPGIPSAPPPGQGGGGPRGPTVAVSGTIMYGGYKAGIIKITAFDGDHAAAGTGHPNVVGMGEIARPGPFTIPIPEGAGKVYIEASVDEDGNGRPDPLEPQGKADRFPVTVSTRAVEGLEITLTRREPPPGGRGQDF